MRFTAFIACLLVAFDCAGMATGLKGQTLFMPTAAWAWWIPAALWSVSGFSILLRGAP